MIGFYLEKIYYVSRTVFMQMNLVRVNLYNILTTGSNVGGLIYKFSNSLYLIRQRLK